MKELLYSLRYRILGSLVLFALLGFGIARYQYEKNTLSARTPDHVVKLEKSAARPARLSVKVGEMVQFDAADGSYHNLAQVTGDEGAENTHESAYESGVFAPDEAYQAVFLKEGSYLFHDHLHDHIRVEIDVYATTTRK